MGAWIEISQGVYFFNFGLVAPLVGAWIEIENNYDLIPCDNVAPLVGAWIEMAIKMYNPKAMLSLLSWERGLKYENRNESHTDGVCRRSSRGSVD